MSREDIIAGNKLMAEYLGYRYYPHTEPYGRDRIAGWINPKCIPKSPYFKLGRSHLDLPFYTNWNQLMRVVEKIEADGDTFVRIVKNSASVYDYTVVYSSSVSTGKIKATWEVCLQYLKIIKNDDNRPD